MRIVVCLKQICMTYARTGKDPEQRYLTPEDMIYRVNPCDEVALEIALRIKDLRGNVEIIILTIGPLIAEMELRRCLAMGANEIHHVDVEEEPDPRWKSSILAQFIKDLNANLVFCGMESLDKRNGQVPAFIANYLELPLVTSVLEMIFMNDHYVTVKRSAGKGVREKVECPLPAVLSVDSGACNPRLPTYSDREKALSAVIRKLEYSAKIPLNKIVSLGTYPPRPRPKKIPAPDCSLEAFDRIERLLAGSLVEKKGTILRGSIESQVGGIIDFLKQKGILISKD